MIGGEKGLVSVIVPTFNRARLLLEALGSVLGQTYRPIELIVVDDGSTDETRETAERWGYKYRDDRFTFTYLFQENAGAPTARNTGLAASHGEFVQFLDSDDLLYPERLSRLVDLFNETSCDYVYTGLERFCGRCGAVIQDHLPDATSDHLTKLCEGRLWGYTGQFCWRKKLIDEIGGWDTELIVYQDYDYIVRTVLTSNNGIALREILCRERMGGGSRISDVRATRAGYEAFLHAANKLCLGIRFSNVSKTVRDKFISYLYYKTLPSYAAYPDLWMKTEELIASLRHGNPSSREFIRPFVWRAGRLCHAMLLLASDAKHRFTDVLLSKGVRRHTCST